MDTGSVKQIAVLYPVGGVGHVGPMTQLGKVFLRHGYDVTIVLIEPPIKSTDSGAGFIERVAASNPSITFHVLPPIPPPDISSSTKHPFLLILELMRQYNDELESFLRSIPRERLHSLVIDLFCTHAIDVAAKLGVPVYKFFASGAGTLAVFAQLPALLAGRQTGLKEQGDSPIEFLGVPPMPASHLVKSLLESPDDELCGTTMKILKRHTGTRGVLVNTFESLESRALQALRDPLCVPGQVLPPVYAIGPLVGKGGTDDEEEGERHECLAWLDAQPERSVVFLCWGSKGALPTEQVKEIAVGLENSGQRFLWVVRTPASSDDDRKRYWEQRAETDLGALLPEGFLERIEGRGLVVKSWAPQVDVLNHPATGLFVTHCGWNSVLEAIAAGVPMLCWPLGSEQKMNKVFVAEDMGVGLEMEGYMTGCIKAEEIERKVRLVFGADEGLRLRKRALELKKETEAALEEDGSSQAAFLQFLSDVKQLRENRAMKQTVVLYPSAGAGHIIPMGELAKVFLNRGYDVTMVIVPPPFKSAALGASNVERLAAANPSMSIHVLPPIPAPDFAGSAKHPFLLLLQLIRQYNEKLESFLRSIPRRLHSLVIDMFCVDALDVAGKLGGVPVYTFSPSGASALAVLTQLPTLMAGRQTGLKELGDTRLEFRGVPPLPASHLVAELLEHPEEELCKTMLSIFERGMDSSGVLVNTFESLERRAVQALRDTLCVPGKAVPPIYCVGPLVGGGGARNGGDADAERHECLVWLDAQPERSVVFLCFGSMGAFSAEQIREIAVGLDKSRQRFLWVVPMTAANVDDPKMLLQGQSEPDIDALLPERFLERTKDRGLVVTSWAPQADVLNHRATGAFVTHCGWNSTMEGLTAGVPMLCWPLYAEQKMNKVFMTEGMGVGMEMQGYDTGFVKAEEVEKKVRLVMESDVGKELKTRVAARKEEAEAALKDGGSSQAAFVQFLSDVENRKNDDRVSLSCVPLVIISRHSHVEK
ncbi:hypothetical protein U9M48_017802 [Paspalum notatum var. saurae]|uniref:UDP-glycosyltransferases domain-containing protein n=1 Tax=Paspalum notatum var. saurae TaxID=547442 RepID=A0AAQ3TAE7_PASNO